MIIFKIETNYTFPLGYQATIKVYENAEGFQMYMFQEQPYRYRLKQKHAIQDAETAINDIIEHHNLDARQYSINYPILESF